MAKGHAVARPVRLGKPGGVAVFPLGRRGSMSREESVRRVARYLRKNPMDAEACRLINLFNLHPEELTEVGVSFETLRGLAPRHLW